MSELQHITVHGRPAVVAFMTAFNGVLTEAADAKVAIVNFSDGQIEHYYFEPKLKTAGGAGSGNFGHAGRPGEIGGSASESEGAETEALRSFVKDSARKFGFPPERIKIEAYKNDFNVGGQAFHEAAHYDPDTGEITLNSDTSVFEAKGLMAHEIAHDMFHQTYEGDTQDPSIQELKKFVEDHRDELILEDGVTDYSKAYWKQYENTPGPSMHRSDVLKQAAWNAAMSETVAEVAYLKEVHVFESFGPRVKAGALWNTLHEKMTTAYRSIKK